MDFHPYDPIRECRAGKQNYSSLPLVSQFLDITPLFYPNGLDDGHQSFLIVQWTYFHIFITNRTKNKITERNMPFIVGHNYSGKFVAHVSLVDLSSIINRFS